MPCTKCGDCCENLVVGDRVHLIRNAARHLKNDLRGVGADDDLSATFIMTRWHVTHYEADTGLPVYRCEMFDPATRECTAHDERPDVCRNYPTYGGDAWGSVEWERYPRCGYVAEMLATMAVGG